MCIKLCTSIGNKYKIELLKEKKDARKKKKSCWIFCSWLNKNKPVVDSTKSDSHVKEERLYYIYTLFTRTFKQQQIQLNHAGRSGLCFSPRTNL